MSVKYITAITPGGNAADIYTRAKAGSTANAQGGAVWGRSLGDILVLKPLSPASGWSPTPGDKSWGSLHSFMAPAPELLQDQDKLLLGGLGAGAQLGWEKKDTAGARNNLP